jgi:hypothetical protein
MGLHGDRYYYFASRCSSLAAGSFFVNVVMVGGARINLFLSLLRQIFLFEGTAIVVNKRQLEATGGYFEGALIVEF